MKKIFLVYIFIFLISGNLAFAADDKFVLVIDAGHGGKDTGATRGDYKEKDINLGVALALGRLIESNMKDVKVVYTRKSDVFIDLYKRSDIANKAKANMFVSIHTNSTASKVTTAEGADTYILGLAKSDENLAVAKRENSVILLEDNYNKRYEGFDPNSPESYIIFEFMTDKYMSQSLEFASLVQKGFKNISKRKDRGVRQAGFLVLRESAMPSVLIELGFINNPTEAKYLSSSTGQRSMASAIFSGLEKYIRDFEKKQGYAVMNSPAPVRNTASTALSSPVVVDTTSKDEYKPEEVATEEVSVPRTKNRSGSSSQRKNSGNSDNSNLFVSKNNQISDSNVNSFEEPISQNQSSQKRVAVNSRAEDVPVVEKRDRTQKVTVAKVAKEPISNSSAKVEPKTQSTKSVSKGTYAPGVTEYRVQILISPNKLPSSSSQFKGLSSIKEYKDGGVYKYTYGSTDNESKAIQMRNDVRAKFKDAFIVKFRDGARIK